MADDEKKLIEAAYQKLLRDNVAYGSIQSAKAAKTNSKIMLGAAIFAAISAVASACAAFFAYLTVIK